MKRFFILASAAIVALASCAKTEVVYKDAPEQIAFKQITGPMTKAALIGTLGVIAHQGETQHFDNTQFTVSSGVWTNASAVWPYEGTLDFTVYAPAGEASFDYSTKTLTVEDVIAGESVYFGEKRYMNTAKTSNAIDVVLKHMSSKITVNVTMNSPYTFQSLTLNDCVTKGDVNVLYTNPDAPVVSIKTSKASGPQSITSGEPFCVLPKAQTSFTIVFTQGALSFTKNIPLSDNWVANSAYEYNISVASPDQINFNATVVDNWDNGGQVNKDQSDFVNVDPQ